MVEYEAMIVQQKWDARYPFLAGQRLAEAGSKDPTLTASPFLCLFTDYTSPCETLTVAILALLI